MADLKEAVQSPGYEAAASTASKATIFVFIATFAYMTFFSEASSGLVGGVLFFAGGIFIASLVIAMPMFLLKSKAPKLSGVVSFLEIAVTIYLTRFAFLWLFSQPAQATETEAQREFVPRSFECEEPLPEFTLGSSSNPTDAELSDLCSCVYAELSDESRRFSQSIRAGEESKLSPSQIQEFIPVFGSAIERCGGKDL